MQLAPVWDELARKVHSGPHDVNIAKLDCTKQKDTCAAMMVQGFPTLRFFDGGNDTPYKTIRTLDALGDFVERAMKPVLADIDTPDALQEMIATNPAFFLALPPSSKTMSKNEAREDEGQRGDVRAVEALGVAPADEEGRAEDDLLQRQRHGELLCCL